MFYDQYSQPMPQPRYEGYRQPAPEIGGYVYGGGPQRPAGIDQPWARPRPTRGVNPGSPGTTRGVHPGMMGLRRPPAMDQPWGIPSQPAPMIPSQPEPMIPSQPATMMGQSWGIPSQPATMMGQSWLPMVQQLPLPRQMSQAMVPSGQEIQPTGYGPTAKDVYVYGNYGMF